MPHRVRGFLTGCIGLTLALTASACSSGGGDGNNEAADGGKVTITVGNLPPATQADLRQQFLDRIAEFEEANPDIDIEPTESKWEAETFAARLAGGQLETVLQVPLTEPQGLIKRGQVADITDEVNELSTDAEFDERALAPVTDAEGHIYGLPTSQFALGLAYNRQLFEQAGLDPDSPPQTWEDVRAAAKTISEKTGMPGFAMPTTNNTGGWVFTAVTYTFGGRLQEESGDMQVATVDTSEARSVLELLQAMRWEDNSMGSQHLRNAQDIAKDFAAGTVGMMIATPSSYNEFATQFGGTPEAWGMAALPEGDVSATLLGGQVAIVSPDASEAEQAAAVQWIDFYYLRARYDAEYAEELAAAKASSNVPVGFPYVSLYAPDVAGPVLQAERTHANVPVENFVPYEEGVAGQEFVTEPAVGAQELYAALDTAIQAVLTRQDADPGAELQAVEDKVAPVLERAQR